MTQAFDPAATFVHLEPDGRAEPIPVTPHFWEEVIGGQRMLDGWLVTGVHSLRSWDQWEQHPAGEELILLTDGAVDLILEWKSSQEAIRLGPAHPMAIVPRGVWHTVDVVEPATLTFVTFGKGTQHRPRRQAD